MRFLLPSQRDDDDDFVHDFVHDFVQVSYWVVTAFYKMLLYTFITIHPQDKFWGLGFIFPT